MLSCIHLALFGHKITQNNSFVQIFAAKILNFLYFGDDLRGFEFTKGTKMVKVIGDWL